METKIKDLNYATKAHKKSLQQAQSNVRMDLVTSVFLLFQKHDYIIY
jgi:hypothetical protein